MAFFETAGGLVGLLQKLLSGTGTFVIGSLSALIVPECFGERGNGISMGGSRGVGD